MIKTLNYGRATNSLDKKSEEMITNQINLIKKEKTIILITHNLKL